MSEEKRFYTVQEATDILGISEEELIRLIDEKKILVLKVGRSLRISEESIDDYLGSSAGNNHKDDDASLEKDLREVFSGELPEESEDRITADDTELELRNLELECEKLIEKKMELEEDINYLEIEYEEFRTKIKKLVVEELKTFLKKVDSIEKINLEEGTF